MAELVRRNRVELEVLEGFMKSVKLHSEKGFPYKELRSYYSLLRESAEMMSWV